VGPGVKVFGFTPPGVDCQPWRKRIFMGPNSSIRADQYLMLRKL
jgi:hypothetical protein